MKYLQILIVFILLGFVNNVRGQTDAIVQFFDQYMNDDRFTMVYISPKMFQMLARLMDDEDSKEIKEIASDIKGLRILTTEHEPQKFYKEAIGKISTKGYEVLMEVRDEGGENVQFFIKENNDIINELLLIVGESDEFVLLSFVGNIDLDKLSKLAESLDIDGLEHLQGIDDMEHTKKKKNNEHNDDDNDKKRKSY